MAAVTSAISALNGASGLNPFTRSTGINMAAKILVDW